MDTKFESTRMTLRLPVELRESLESAVAGGSSSSVTAEIINRLKKSLSTDPIDTDDAFSIIKQHAAKIQETITRAATKTETKPSISRQTALKSLSTHEQKLLEAFNSLSDEQQSVIIDSLLSMISTLKT